MSAPRRFGNSLRSDMWADREYPATTQQASARSTAFSLSNPPHFRCYTVCSPSSHTSFSQPDGPTFAQLLYARLHSLTRPSRLTYSIFPFSHQSLFASALGPLELLPTAFPPHTKVIHQTRSCANVSEAATATPCIRFALHCPSLSPHS